MAPNRYTLRVKRDEIVRSIRLYERRPRYVDTHRLFKRGETWTLCQQLATRYGPGASPLGSFIYCECVTNAGC
jgi:hypothetical protein